MTPTDDQRRAAWAKCRCKAWPPTYEETITDPVRARLVDIVAIGMATARKPLPERSAKPTYRTHFRAPDPRRADIKRAAAGDRDD